MKSYATFVHQLLVSLSYESSINGVEFYDARELIRKYNIGHFETWIDRFIEDCRAFTYADMRRTPGIAHHSGRTSVPGQLLLRENVNGRSYVESFRRESIATLLAASPRSTREAVERHFHTAGEATRDAIHSSLWTGIEEGRELPESAKDEILRDIEALDRAVDESELSNAVKAATKARIEAVRSLINSPDPNWHEIVAMVIKILSHPGLAAALVILDIGAKIVTRILAG